tara:strand:- start:2203 stop:2727 length:525 start_codon:yes stop_codon:yes gene_type:complete
VNNLQIYVDYAQPVVKAINEHHNQFYTLWYYNLSPEDLFAEDGLIEYMTEDKNVPADFNGNMPMVYAQWGEETGASMVLEISPENRKLLSPEVLDVIKTEYLEYHVKWRKTADKTIYLLMDHEYYQTCAGFAPSNDFEDSVNVDDALDFLSHRLGLNYLHIDRARTDLEWKLQQ